MQKAWLGLLIFVLGCWDQEQGPPGELIGTFEARGLMVEQSCGAAVPAPDPLELTFDLRSEPPGRAYYLRRNGPLFAGVEKDGEYRFQVSQSWTVIEPDRFRGYPGCSVTQRDVFTFEIETVDGGIEGDAGVGDSSAADAGSEPSRMSLSGSQTTDIEPLTGSDCTPAVAAAGGPFLSLPCRVGYVLTGSGVAVE